MTYVIRVISLLLCLVFISMLPVNTVIGKVLVLKDYNMVVVQVK